MKPSELRRLDCFLMSIRLWCLLCVVETSRQRRTFYLTAFTSRLASKLVGSESCLFRSKCTSHDSRANIMLAVQYLPIYSLPLGTKIRLCHSKESNRQLDDIAKQPRTRYKRVAVLEVTGSVGCALGFASGCVGSHQPAEGRGL